MNKLILALSAMILITGCASDKPTETAINPIDAFEMECRINSPQKLCSCVSSRLRTRVDQGENILDVMSDKDNSLHDTTTSCMISTGMVRAMMDNFSLSCYVDNPEDVLDIGPENRNIEYLQNQHPEKTKKCSCLQSEIDKLDERFFIKESMAANKQYESFIKCTEKNPAAECEKPKLSFAEMIKKKCGL